MTYHDKKQRPGEVDRLLFLPSHYERSLLLEQLFADNPDMSEEVKRYLIEVIYETQGALGVLHTTRRKLDNYLAGGEFDD